MNKLSGTVTEVISEGQLSLVNVAVAGGVFCSIVVDTPASAPYLRVGGPMHVLFKENEVVIAKSFAGQISLQNRMDCKIAAIETGKLLCQVTLAFHGSTVVSLITAQAAIQMDLKVGDGVTGMVKTNEISLSPND